MTNTIVPAVDTASIIAEFSGGSAPTVDLMIGVGLVKDSEAVFFQYLGDDNNSALMQANGRPVTRIGNVYLTGLSVADEIGEFNMTKLNVYLETQQGRTMMLTSGLTTIWSQCLMTGLQGLADEDRLQHLVTIDSWKGTSKMKPCFAAVKDGQRKLTNDAMYQALADARADRDSAKTASIMRDAVEMINAAITGSEVQVTEVADIKEELF